MNQRFFQFLREKKLLSPLPFLYRYPSIEINSGFYTNTCSRFVPLMPRNYCAIKRRFPLKIREKFYYYTIYGTRKEASIYGIYLLHSLVRPVREAQTHAHNNGRGAQKQAGYFYRREEEKNKKWKIPTAWSRARTL